MTSRTWRAARLSLAVLLGLVPLVLKPSVGTAVAANAARVPDLSACPDLAVPEGNKVLFHVYATGVQIYRWNGTAWTFVAPEALLTADAGYHGVVGTHFAGPTWQSLSGSKVVGAVIAPRCTVEPDAIPWLLLSAVGEAPGIFARVTYIQRVNTTGGTAPSEPGDLGEEVRVPYIAEYVFYRAHRE